MWNRYTLYKTKTIWIVVHVKTVWTFFKHDPKPLKTDFPLILSMDILCTVVFLEALHMQCHTTFFTSKWSTSITSSASLVFFASVVRPVVDVVKSGSITNRHRQCRSSAMPTWLGPMAKEETLRYQPLEGQEIFISPFPGPEWMIKQAPWIN